MIRFLIDHGAELALGTSVVLAIGSVAVLALRSPLHKKRVAVVTLRVWCVWLVLALVPMSRPLVEVRRPAQEVANVEPAAAKTSQHVAMPSTPASPTPTAETVASPARAASAPSDTPRVGLAELLAHALVFGGAASIVYVLLAWLVLRRRLRATRRAPAWLDDLVTELGPEVRRLRVAILAGARPFCSGLRTPTIVLPPELLQADRRERLRCVLLHELSHIRERDVRDHALVAATLPVLYWNPLFWLLRSQLRLNAELVADAIAVQGCDRTSYVRELIELATSRPRTRHRVPAVSVLGIETDFSRRMTMLLTRTSPLSTETSRFESFARNAIALTVLSGVTMAFGTELPAQDPSPVPTARKSEPKTSAELDIEWVYKTPEDLQCLIEMLSRNDRLVSVNLGEPTKGGRRLTARIRSSDSKQTMRELHAKTGKGVLLVSVKRLPSRTQPTKSSPLVRFAFEETDIRKVIDTISQCAGANIVLSPEVQGTLTMRLHDVPWRNALEAAVKALGYVVTEEPGGILIITTPSNPLVKQRGK